MSLTVRRPGLLTTIQDLGRAGHRASGVTSGGAMDVFALRIANLLVGNDEGAAGVEVTLLGPTLRFDGDHLCAIGGADLGARLDGIVVPPWRPFFAPAGSELAFEGPRIGCRAMIAVAGGVDVPVVLGGRGTDLRGGFGGYAGRALAAGDMFAIGVATAAARISAERLRSEGRAVARWGAGPSLTGRHAAPATVRILDGPEYASLNMASRETLEATTFSVLASSDRMGYRLAGGTLQLEMPLEMISSPVMPGTVQLPPSGDPIVLMADGQTTGGYPRIANVISADLPLLAQCAPGAPIRFRRVAPEDARRALLSRNRDLRQLADAIRLRGA